MGQDYEGLKLLTISVPFTFTDAGVATTDDPDEIARQEIINILMTEKYERVMDPSYGAGTARLLFQTLDSLVVADYKEETLAHLNRHLSNCVVMALNITDKPPDGSWSGPGDPEATLYVNAQYRLNSSLTSSTLSMSLVNPNTVNVFTPL